MTNAFSFVCGLSFEGATDVLYAVNETVSSDATWEPADMTNARNFNNKVYRWTAPAAIDAGLARSLAAVKAAGKEPGGAAAIARAAAEAVAVASGANDPNTAGSILFLVAVIVLPLLIAIGLLVYFVCIRPPMVREEARYAEAIERLDQGEDEDEDEDEDEEEEHDEEQESSFEQHDESTYDDYEEDDDRYYGNSHVDKRGLRGN